MKMEGSVKSGVLKKKSSSGCLIIKNKFGDKNPGGGLGGLSDNNNNKEKNRARLLESESGSSSSSSNEDESLEFMRRKVNEKRLNNSSKLYKRKELENREGGGDNISGERKRGRLDLFDFDEYDEFDEKKMRRGYMEDMAKKTARNGIANLTKFSNGSSDRNFAADKRKQDSYFDGSNSGRKKGLAMEDDEANMPISMLRLKYQKTAGEPIRVQGKNGVLKVMVNKKKKMDFPIDLKERKVLRSDDIVEKDLFVDKLKSVEKEKIKGGLEVYSSKKRMKNEEMTSTRLENFTPLKGEKGKEGNEGKAQRGGSTEKQMLREKIRGMLVDAGWNIDYRPRRNRDYLDSVYINPRGTAYWSITKAYDALKKQLEEDNGKTKAKNGSPSFVPLSEDLIHKLTRQTKKKIKEEMKRKRKEDKCAESSDSDQNDGKLQKGKMSKVDSNSDDDSSDHSQKRKREKFRVGKPSTAFNSDDIIQGKQSKVMGRCTLMVRGYDKGESSDSDGYVPYSGKRTVLAWLIDSGTARLSEKVQYMNRKRNRVMLEGWITRDGVHCGCCSKILTFSKFELHAGSKLRQPFQNIFLESGSTLLQCQIDAWNSQEESLRRDFCIVDVDGDDPDDDTCAICGDGGDLICCDSCPSTFHQICLEIQVLPSGNWHCPNCTCKFCDYGSGNVAEENNSTVNELNRCSFCEKKYHNSCGEKANALPMSSNGASFCGLKCQELYDHLQKILGIKHELEAGFSWSLIQRKDMSDDSHHGFPQRVECNSKLAVALSVMNECFLPIVDRKSGINLIHNVVYNCGSNFNRLNYRGFYTAILERGDEIISAASIRLHGDRLAEMPFIATREIYRRMGMCRRLLSAIETELCSLEVGQLIIPTISEHANTWTTVFCFHELEDVHKKEIKSLNMLVFPGTDMLQKQLVQQENSDGVKVLESTNNEPQLPILVEKSDRQANSAEIEAMDSGSPPPIIPSEPIFESDNTIALKPEVENEQKKSSDNSNCSLTPSKSNNSSEKSDRQASNAEIDAMDSGSGSPAPTIPSEPIFESDNTIALNPEVENEQKKSSDNLNCSLTPSKSNNSSEKSDRQASNAEIDAMDSGSPAPTIPSEPIFESDNTIALNPEVENEQKKSSDNLNCSLTPSKSNNSSDNCNAEAVVDNAWLIEPNPSPESEHIHDISGETPNASEAPGSSSAVILESCSMISSVGCSMAVSREAGPTKPVDDSRVEMESLPDSVVNEEALEQFNGYPNGTTLPVAESQLHLPIEPSPVSAIRNEETLCG